MGAPKNLGVDLFRSCRTVWIFVVPLEGIIESKNLFCQGFLQGPITYDWPSFQTLLGPHALVVILNFAGGGV